ncbi:flagellar protein FlaG [Uliginosibacterium gangwonense]|uniref:flagellar protein FlaG n=1 Tax=Uliginosibacterium gangwonense TaxID=392736 RepID=UPI0003A8D208|nr:flagellar protein FlaG [Uliginosibacterium gangwonense]
MAMQPIASYSSTLSANPNATAKPVERSESVKAKVDDKSLIANQSTETTSATSQASAQPSREQVDQAMKEVKQALPLPARNLQFSIDEDTGKTVVKVVDPTTKEVIRQIPSEEILAIAKALDKSMTVDKAMNLDKSRTSDQSTGLLVKQKV